MTQAGLTLEKASKSFGGIRVVTDVDLHVTPGEIIALLGENGAGKSTLLKMIGGVHQPDSPAISLDGKAVNIADVRTARSYGIAMVHQELNLTDNQTVQQNLFLGREPRSGLAGALGFIDQKRMASEAQAALDIVGSRVDRDMIIGELSLAQQQQIEIAKALSQTDVSYLLLDEPTSSLPEEQANDLLGLLRRLRDRGLAIVITTHRMDEAFTVADRIVIMRDGEKVSELRSGDEAMNKNSVIEKMVGRELTTLFPGHRAESGEALLEVSKLTGGIVNNVSFEVRKGEVFGLGGLVGAGRTEIVRRIFGADRSSSISLKLNGKHVTINHPKEAVVLGIGLVPEDRKSEGLVQLLSVQANIALPNLRDWSAWGFIDFKRLHDTVAKFIGQLNVRLRAPAQAVSSLSGGNQQKVVLAKWMAQPLKLLILDEPTRGVDVGARSEIYRHIDEIARSGIGILLVSSDMEELVGLSDRIGVMAGGQLTGILAGDEISQKSILKLASKLNSI